MVSFAEFSRKWHLEYKTEYGNCKSIRKKLYRRYLTLLEQYIQLCKQYDYKEHVIPARTVVSILSKHFDIPEPYLLDYFDDEDSELILLEEGKYFFKIDGDQGVYAETGHFIAVNNYICLDLIIHETAHAICKKKGINERSHGSRSHGKGYLEIYIQCYKVIQEAFDKGELQ